MKRSLPLLPSLLFLIWLAGVGSLVWRKAHMTQFPPSPDPFSYIQKAVHFWDNAKKGFPRNPLNLTQPFRPPGTVLISYPFGYDRDHGGFLFRTVYIPFLIWTGAVLLLFWPTAQCRDRRVGVSQAILAAILFGASPFLFHLEYGDGHTAWGLMDQALGAVSGFAMAAMVRGVFTRSVILLFTAVAMGCFAILIKPTGGLVLFFCGLFLVLSETMRGLERRRKGLGPDLGFMAKGIGLFGLMGGFVVWACMNSRYLDAEAVKTHSHAQAIMRSINTEIGLFDGTLRLYAFLGPQGVLLILLVMMLLSGFMKGIGRAIGHFPVIFSVILWTVGFYLWIGHFGFSNVRYYSLFAYMGLATMLGWTASRIDGIPFRNYAVPLTVSTVLACLNFLALLAVREPDRRWEKAFGTDVGVATDIGDDGRATQYLLKRYEGSEKEPVVYNVSLKTGLNYFFLMNSDFRRMEEPDYRGYRMLGDVNWYGNPAVDLYELIYMTDLLLCPKPGKTNERKPWTTSREMGQEREGILDFINGSLGSGWISVEAGFGQLNLLRIVDKDRFAAAFDSAFSNAEWSPQFVQANGIRNGRMHVLETGSDAPPLPESSEVEWKKMRGSIYQIDKRESREDTLVTTRGLALEGWLLADAEKRPVMADSIYLTIDRAGRPTRFYPTVKKDRPELGRYTARIDLKGMDTCRLGMAMAKDGRIHRFPGFRRTVIVDPDALDRGAGPLP